MSEVKDVRAALERLRNRRQSNTGLESAIVSEGLAACDELEERQARFNDPSMRVLAAQYHIPQVDLLATILRKAGLL